MFHKLKIIAAFLISMPLVFSQSALAGGNIAVVFGTKMLSDGWEPVTDQQEFGVMIDFGSEETNTHIVFDYLTSEDTASYFGLPITGKTTEINIGARSYKYSENNSRSYVGGGLAIIDGSFGTSFYSESDKGTGFWFGAGFQRLDGELFYGLDLRISKADITLFGISEDAGGTHINLTVGSTF